jgi:hypothetical protein
MKNKPQRLDAAELRPRAFTVETRTALFAAFTEIEPVLEGLPHDPRMRYLRHADDPEGSVRVGLQELTRKQTADGQPEVVTGLLIRILDPDAPEPLRFRAVSVVAPELVQNDAGQAMTDTISDGHCDPKNCRPQEARLLMSYLEQSFGWQLTETSGVLPAAA